MALVGNPKKMEKNALNKVFYNFLLLLLTQNYPYLLFVLWITVQKPLHTPPKLGYKNVTSKTCSDF